MENILEVCVKHKVSAVHPGYGFLSERSAFCELLEKNGVVFIGPKAKCRFPRGARSPAPVAR
jgi:propionyl-CoA carboxylase alpha chain